MLNFILGCLFTYSGILTLELVYQRKTTEKRINMRNSRKNHPTYRNVINL